AAHAAISTRRAHDQIVPVDSDTRAKLISRLESRCLNLGLQIPDRIQARVAIRDLLENEDRTMVPVVGSSKDGGRASDGDAASQLRKGERSRRVQVGPGIRRPARSPLPEIVKEAIARDARAASDKVKSIT